MPIGDPPSIALCAEYEDAYDVAPDFAKGVRATNRCAMARGSNWACAPSSRRRLQGIHHHLRDLHGLKQLPGLAVQRLMAEGYGFGAEGDWKTCALLRAMKVMAEGLPGGTSFMEDYTYHLDPAGPPRARRAHAGDLSHPSPPEKPSLEIHPLGIGGKEDPVRLVFDAPAGPAINASHHRSGQPLPPARQRSRVVAPPQPLPKLPVARAVWKCRPDFKTACAAWIYAGGAHHTGFSYAVTTEHMEDFAEIAGIETAIIDAKTELRDFRQELRNNEIYYHLAQGLGRV